MVEDQEDPVVVLEEGSTKEHIVEDQLDEPHEADCKDLVEEDKSRENSNYDDLMNISVCADVRKKIKEEATNFEEELKFLEAWLETPCLYEINTEVASMNDEDNIADV